MLQREHTGATLVNRVRLPRIRTFLLDDLGRSAAFHCYWPMSQRVAAVVKARALALRAGKADKLPPLTFAELEGLDLRTVWDPVIAGHPSADPEWWGYEAETGS